MDYTKLQLNRDLDDPLHIQLKNALLRELRGPSQDSEQTILMSERELAATLQVNRITVHRAYAELLANGLVRKLPNKSLVVSADAPKKIAGHFRVIGLLLPMDFADYVDYNNGNALPYLKGIISQASKLNASCMMLNPPPPEASKEELDAYLDEYLPKLCGIIHLGALCIHDNSELFLQKMMERQDIPQVCISGHSDLPHLGSVYASPEQGMKAACTELLRRGARTLGIIRASKHFHPSHFHYIAETRCASMAQLATKAGLTVTYQGACEDRDDIAAMLRSPAQRPDALFCHNDQIAAQIREIAIACGLAIPQDLMLLGYDARNNDGDLATIAVDRQKVAAEAVNLLIKTFENGVLPEQMTKVLPSAFVNGRTMETMKCPHRT